jgi:hypothetical protein
LFYSLWEVTKLAEIKECWRLLIRSAYETIINSFAALICEGFSKEFSNEGLKEELIKLIYRYFWDKISER